MNSDATIFQPSFGQRLDQSNSLTQNLKVFLLPSFTGSIGDALNDWSGNGWEGVAYGSPVFTQGLNGNALFFNNSTGFTQYINTSFPGVSGAGERSLSFSICVKQFGGDYYIGYGQPAPGLWWQVKPSQTRLDLDFGGGSVPIGFSQALVINTWYSVAVIYDGSYLKVFINGVYQGELACTFTTIATKTYGLDIGGVNSWYGTNFSIYNVLFHTRALSDSEAKKITNPAFDPRSLFEQPAWVQPQNIYVPNRHIITPSQVID